MSLLLCLFYDASTPASVLNTSVRFAFAWRMGVGTIRGVAHCEISTEAKMCPFGSGKSLARFSLKCGFLGKQQRQLSPVRIHFRLQQLSCHSSHRQIVSSIIILSTVSTAKQCQSGRVEYALVRSQRGRMVYELNVAEYATHLHALCTNALTFNFIEDLCLPINESAAFRQTY